MFRPKKMGKVRMIVLKSHVESLIKDLHEAGLVDIRKSRYEGLDEGRPLASFDEISGELLKLRTLLSMMEQATGRKAGRGAKRLPAHEALEEARSLGFDEKLRELNDIASGYSERIKALENEALIVEKVVQFKGVDFSKLRSRTLDYRAGELSPAKAAKLSEGLDRLGGHTALISEPEYNAALVIFERKQKEDVEALLGEMGFSDIELPEGITTPIEAINRINAENDGKKEMLAQVKKAMADLSKSHMDMVSDLIISLEVAAERAEVASRFSSSKQAYVIEGWMLEEDGEKLRSIAGGYPDVIVDEVHFSHDEMPPTVLKNPPIASPFEFLTNSYSLPNYYEIDPTMMYFIFLPIVYGMIVGDVIYGLMSMGLAYLFLKKFEKSYIMSNVSKIWLYAGIPSMAFGVFYDEWGGMSHFHLLELAGRWLGTELVHAPLYAGLSRIENVLALVMLSALVGVIHLGAGFIIGAINEWNHSRKHAFAKIAWLGVEIGIALSLLPYLPSMLPEMGHIDMAIGTAGLVLLVISIIGLAATEGILGIIEIPGIVGNILSYSRIAAIGIVGVVIAELLNEFVVPLPEQGILALVMLPIFFLLHVLNCFVAMFESIVQGGRLNIVEFKSKFMQGGGGVFTPFALYSKKY
ncbi:MAG: V-type ATPase 116kDa subunit family protein [Candidatus Micrarchaeota archaeon]